TTRRKTTGDSRSSAIVGTSAFSSYCRFLVEVKYHGRAEVAGTGARLPPSFSQDLSSGACSGGCTVSRFRRRNFDAIAAPTAALKATASSRSLVFSIFMENSQGSFLRRRAGNRDRESRG